MKHPGARSILDILPLLLLFPSPGWSAGEEAGDAALEQAIDDAIDRGAEFLLAEIRGSDGWVPENLYPSGYIALQLYALLKSDVSYVHPTILEGFRLLETAPRQKVYSVSLELMAYDAVLQQMDEDARSGGPLDFQSGREPVPLDREHALKQMRAALNWLIAARVRGEGTWGYEPMNQRDEPRKAYYDHSNSQFAILALGVAAQRGLPVPRALWEEIADHFIKLQEPSGDPVSALPGFTSAGGAEGKAPPRTSVRSSALGPPPGAGLYSGGAQALSRGWGYMLDRLGPKPTFSMTAAGQSSILLAYRSLAQRDSSSKRTKALKKAIRDGYGWLTRFLDADKQGRWEPYALYSLEKAGDIGEVQTFGACRWYERGARILLSLQYPTGSWDSFRTPAARHNTALALLYLGRASSFEARPLIHLTGPGGKPEEFGSRYRVYLQSLGAHVPVIRFFRKVRNRPSPRLLKLCEELIEAYDPDYRDEVALLLKTLELSPFQKVQDQRLRLLERLTGLKAEEAGDCREWAKQWAEVVAAGRRQQATAGRRLRELLKATASPPLRLKIIWALERTGARAAIGDLIALMESGDASLRKAAHGAAAALSGKDFPFHPEGPEKSRSAEIERWKEWWREASAAAPENGR